jgi:phosphate transport system substrate-binding protein
MAVLMLSSADVVAYVAAHPGAIGYLSAGYLAFQTAPGPPVRALRVEGVPPTPAQVGAGSYRLTQPLFLVAPDEPTGAARWFVDLCLGAEGQALVAQGYAPVRKGGP